MKFFSWMKSKIHCKDNTIKPEPEEASVPSYDDPCKGEISGCSSTLLSIGTFGNNLEDSENKANNQHASTSSSNSQEISDHVETEAELRLLLNEHGSMSSGESERFDLPIEKMLEILPLPLHQEMMDKEIATILQDDHNPSCTRKSSTMYRKSLTFLLKKAFLCGGGFAPAPIFKNPFPDTNLDRSTMDKIMKAVLRKNKLPQKYLEEEAGEANNSNKWVKSDSEYIFLDL